MNNNTKWELEAVLFASGDAVPKKRLCAALSVDEKELERAADELSSMYDNEGRGICLIRVGDKLQLCSRPEYAPVVRSVLETRKTQPLSASALEVLSIVAYEQPVTKVRIELIRGVDSSYTVSSLCEKGFIEDAGRLEVPGRPMTYRTTDLFLRTFGLQSLDDLPPRLIDTDSELLNVEKDR